MYNVLQTKLTLLVYITMLHTVSEGHTGVAFHFVYWAKLQRKS